MTAQHKTDVPENVVASIEDQLDARRRAKRGHLVSAAIGDIPTHSHEQTDDRTTSQNEASRLKGEHLYNWRLLKRARFNAAKRLRNGNYILD